MEICLSIVTIVIYIYLIKKKYSSLYQTYRLIHDVIVKKKKKLADIHSGQFAVPNTARTTSHKARNTLANYPPDPRSSGMSTRYKGVPSRRSIKSSSICIVKECPMVKHHWDVCIFRHINIIGVVKLLKCVYSASYGGFIPICAHASWTFKAGVGICISSNQMRLRGSRSTNGYRRHGYLRAHTCVCSYLSFVTHLRNWPSALHSVAHMGVYGVKKYESDFMVAVGYPWLKGSEKRDTGTILQGRI